MNNKLMSYKDMLSTETIGEISSNIDMFYNLSYKLSTYIFDYRINHKLSQKDFAKTIGVKQAMVSKLESGDYNISLESICNVMAKLNTKVDFNFQFNEAQDPNVLLDDKADRSTNTNYVSFDECKKLASAS